MGHTGQLFEPTESSAFGPRGFSFTEDPEIKRAASFGSSGSSASQRIPRKCDEEEEELEEENTNGGGSPVKFAVGDEESEN